MGGVLYKVHRYTIQEGHEEALKIYSTEEDLIISYADTLQGVLMERVTEAVKSVRYSTPASFFKNHGYGFIDGFGLFPTVLPLKYIDQKEQISDIVKIIESN